jgi:hypothetical protein
MAIFIISDNFIGSNCILKYRCYEQTKDPHTMSTHFFKCFHFMDFKTLLNSNINYSVSFDTFHIYLNLTF